MSNDNLVTQGAEALCDEFPALALRSDYRMDHVARIAQEPVHRAYRELVEAVEKVLADEESQKGGWGPDVTMVEVLRTALEKVKGER